MSSAISRPTSREPSASKPRRSGCRPRHDHATDQGFGEVHIQARHGAELFEAGYDDVAQFTLNVVKGFDAIHEGHGGALLLVKQGERNQIVVIDLRPFGIKGDINWEIATAAIYKPKYFKNKKLLWSKPDSVSFPPTGEPPFDPRSQNHLNISQRVKISTRRASPKVLWALLEMLRFSATRWGYRVSRLLIHRSKMRPLGVRGEEPALIIPKSDALTKAPDGTFGATSSEEQ